MKKPRWEKKFDKYVEQEPISEKIASLSEEIENIKSGKIEGEFKTKQEYEEAKSKRDGEVEKLENQLEGYKNYEKNKEKINNILEYRKKLEKKLEGLPKDVTKELELKKSEFLETQLYCSIHMENIENIHKKINMAKSDEEKGKLQKELQTERGKLEKVQDKQYELMPEIKKLQDQSKEFDEKTEGKRAIYERKIAKCNILAANLLKGKDINDIELNVENKGKRFTAEGKEAEKAKSIREIANRLIINPKTLELEGIEKAKDLEDGSIKDIETGKGKDDEKALSKVSEFAKKHPMLARIGNFFKNIKDKIVKVPKEEEPKKHDEVMKEIKEKIEDFSREEIEDFSREEIEDFSREDEDLKRIAEIGAKDHFTKMREELRVAAANRDVEKHGEAYRSYANKLNERIKKEDEGR